MRSYAGIREVVPGMNNLTVELDPAAPDADNLLQALRTGWHESDAASVSPRRIEIPVHYGGAAGCDLDEVARHTGLSVADVIRLHSGAWRCPQGRWESAASRPASIHSCRLAAGN